MDTKIQQDFGPDSRINLTIFDDWKKFSIVLSNCNTDNFINAARAIVLDEKTARQPYKFISYEEMDSNLGSAVDRNSAYTDSKIKPQPNSEEERMSDFTKDELQAHLSANKAEVNAIASSMKKDMAEWREQMRSDLRDVTDAINKQNSTLDKHFHSQEVKLRSSLELQSSKFDLSLTNVKLDIIKWALGLPSLAFIIYKIYGVLTNNPTP